MLRVRLTAVAAVCGSAMLMAQAPAGPGRGAAPAGPPPTTASPQNPPPVPADANQRTGQGQPGALFGKAHANITGVNGLKGTADFYEIANGINGHMMQVVLNIEGAPHGIHGVHIHAVGKCDAPGYMTAGGHFDPGPAGDSNPDTNHPFHMGDLPNVTVANNGTGSFNVYSTRITMGGPTSIFDADGSAIVIHANLDPGVGGAAGSGISGGPRIGCGVIER
jgi:Cu-Zn family superoxide dismutase